MFIKNSILLIIAFVSAFFPRVLSGIGFPAPINFVHLIFVPAIALYIVSQTKTKARIYAVFDLLTGLMILLGVVIASALFNHAGIINVFLDYILRAEWFIFLLIMVSINPSKESLNKIRFSLMSFAFINILFAFTQKFILRWGEGKPAPGDYITGVFLGQGAGCDVSSGVSIIFALYYFSTAKKSPLWIRISVIVAAVVHIFITDAKSHFIIFLVSLAIVMVTKLNFNIKTITLFAQYLILFALFLGGLYWAAHTVAPGLLTFSEPELIQDGIDLKLSVFSIIPSFYKSSINVLFGLGPGHTIGRLGAWILRDYEDLLSPLGATTSPTSQAVWDAFNATWIGARSRLWSPFFGWAGIWGDWGILGLICFGYVLFIIWRRFCVDDICKIILLSVVIFGFIFTQMEEPGYVISVAAIIGLRWQEEQRSKEIKRHLSYLSEVDSTYLNVQQKNLQS
ncbi:MAG: hypothetical protein AAF378_16645 [Cyanobacteria bacterium P01_A01_bin.84]